MKNVIEFYDIETGKVIDNKYDIYFVRGDCSVWRDNLKTWESQSSVIGFEDCCMFCPKVGWRVTSNA